VKGRMYKAPTQNHTSIGQTSHGAMPRSWFL